MKNENKLTTAKISGFGAHMLTLALLAVMSICALSMAVLAEAQEGASALSGTQDMETLTKDVTQGALRIVKKDGELVECPLKHTDVEAEVSGFIARVRVRQTFYNPLDEKIEAVYVFPLPHKAAVDDMTMLIGQRRIVGLIKRRAEARRIYEEALTRGATAALLEQERPNIFTQSVGNIKPKQEIQIEISYVDVLEYDMGVYRFHFPMVVGPRYIPGRPTSKIPPLPEELRGKVGELDKTKVLEGEKEPKGTGWAPDTDRVPDASRITPPVLKPGYRNGHDISLSLRVDAGVPIQDLKVTNHEARIRRNGSSKVEVKLSPADSIPNKDFVLKYAVVGKRPEMAILTHTDQAGAGYFMLMIQPKEDERLKKTPPREIVFLVDVSGSMSGQPTAKVRKAMAQFIKLCKPNDTIQVITFAGQARKLFDGPVAVTPENTNTALGFTRGLRGGGGTEMLKGIKMAINEPLDPERLRIVVMLSDGFIGNEAEIIGEVGRRCGDQIRFWCVGIGSSPNQFLIDGVARQGGGMSKVLGLKDEIEPLVQEIMFRIHRAQLAKIKIDWGRLNVFETYPAKIPELWAGRPIVLFGRYQTGGQSEIGISGLAEGESVTWSLDVELPATVPQHDVLAKVWARNKIEELMHQTFYAGSPEVEELVTDIALQYRLMSQYTSFVAVDESEIGKLVDPARPPRRMLVPVPIPEGTRYEGFFGPEMHLEESLEMGGPILGLSAKKARPSRSFVSLSRRRIRAVGEIRGRGLAGRRWGGGGAPMDKPASVSKGRYFFSQALSTSGPAAPREALLGSLGYLGPMSERGIKYDMDANAAYGFTDQAFREQIQEHTKQAQAALKEAEELQRQGHLLVARSKFAHAYLLGMAGDGSSVHRAVEAIEKINQKLLESWDKDASALNKRLNLVIRDKSLAQALEALSQASGLKVKLIPGSVEDAAAVMRRKNVRVSYLDLRRATAAEALDWMLRPLRMSWWVENGTVVVATARRSSVKSPWVYDVSVLALPTKEKLEEIKDYQKRIEAAKQAAEQFAGPVRNALKATDGQILWYSPGHLLIFGDAVLHEQAVKLFADLADPDARLEAQLAELHKTTSQRAQERRERVAKVLVARERVRVHLSLINNSWRLLAAAAGSELDPEALTELQIAWRQSELVELLKGPGAAATLRSMWAITESADALTDEKELTALAKSVREMCRSAADEAIAALKKSPEDATAYLQVLYAALAMKDNTDFLAQAVPILTASGDEKSRLASLRKLSAMLLLPAEQINGKDLVEIISNGPPGEDMVVLTALACRRAGGEAWTRFRIEARAILGDQPLPASVVVLVNNLSNPDLKLVVALR